MIETANKGVPRVSIPLGTPVFQRLGEIGVDNPKVSTPPGTPQNKKI